MQETVYLSFFLGRSWLVCPHLRFLQFVARGGRRAYFRDWVSQGTQAARSRVGSYVALAADHLVAVELAGQGLERGLNDAAAETEDEVESRLLRARNLSASLISSMSSQITWSNIIPLSLPKDWFLCN